MDRVVQKGEIYMSKLISLLTISSILFLAPFVKAEGMSGTYEYEGTIGLRMNFLEVNDYGNRIFIELSSISSRGSSCTFSGKGKLINNTAKVSEEIEVEKAKKVMCEVKIMFSERKANVEMGSWPYKCDSMLCGMGATLIPGNYVKMDGATYNPKFKELLDRYIDYNGKRCSLTGKIVCKDLGESSDLYFLSKNKRYELEDGSESGAYEPFLSPYTNNGVVTIYGKCVKDGNKDTIVIGCILKR
jgi:hypothetical protein